MKKTWGIAVSLLIMIVMVFSFWVQYSEAASGCLAPVSAVKVTVKQDAGKPVYEFDVTNKHDVPIYVMFIGVGEKRTPWHKGIDATPKEVVSPGGWAGEYINLGEDTGAFYIWSVERDSVKHDFTGEGIAPGETLSGFKLVMNKPLDILKTLQFRARFMFYGQLLGCVNGTVVAEE